MKNNQVNYSTKVLNGKTVMSIICFAIVQLIFPKAKLIFTITPIAFIFYFKQLFYSFLHGFIWILSKIIYKTDVSGFENIPTKSGGIIVSNHVSMLDALLIVATTKRNVRFVMHDKVFNIPVIGFFFKKLNMIPISSKKNKEGLAAFNLKCKEEVDKGNLVCIFPEGELTRNGQLSAFRKGIEHLAKTISAPIIPIHMDNVIGTPLSFKPGTHHKYGFNLKTIQKKVFITIGSPINNIESAFQLRQVVKKLELENISRRIQPQKTTATIFNIKQQLIKEKLCNTTDCTPTFNNLITSAPNYKVKDLMGTEVTLIGSKQGSIGRPIPGVLIKIISESNQELPANTAGNIYMKHCFTKNSNWENTGNHGLMDEAGFITLSN